MTTAEPPPGPPLAHCPACLKVATWRGNPARPFCSITCKLVDLGGWLDERFRIADERESGDPAPEQERPRVAREST